MSVEATTTKRQRNNDRRWLRFIPMSLMTAGSCKRREFWNERELFSQRLPAMEHIFRPVK
jgi:hypothetical protein